jgi:hypothetical protein
MRFHLFRPFRPGAGLALCLGLLATGCGTPQTTATASLTWQIVDAAAPDPNTAPALTCAQKKVATIRVQMSPSPPSGGVFDFPCANMAGETFSVPAGVYTVQAIALNDSFQAVAQTTFQQRLFGQTSLGHVIFQVR